jgi:AcrR family transcriptional regulator
MVDGRRERGETTRAQLVTAARALFGEHGYDATSTEAVLGRAGEARGTLYHHFPSKAALFDAVLEQVIAEVADAAAQAARGVADPLEGLRMGSRAWLRLALDPTVQRIALLDPPTVVGWRRWRELDEQYTLGGLRASFRRLADEGRVPSEQTELLAHMLLASLTEAALFITQADDPDAAAQAGQATIDTVLDRLTGTPVVNAP